MTEYGILLAEIAVGLSVFNGLMLVAMFLDRSTGRGSEQAPPRPADEACAER